MISVGSIVLANGVKCKVLRIGDCGEGRIWVEVTPVNFVGRKRKIALEDTEEV